MLRCLVPGALLVLLIGISYAPVRFAGFIWDDDQYVTDNAVLTQPSGLADIWLRPGATPQYYPLVFTTFWLERRLWGLDPLGYHAVNVALHAANAVCLWRLLVLLGVPGAWYAAALFGLHPVHVESVAWITERKNVLSGLFYFLALLAYLRFRPIGAAASRAHGWYAAALGLFVAALLSKTVTCSLPAVIVLLLWWKNGRVTGKDAAYLTPFFALGLALALVTVQMEKHHVGAHGAAWDFTLLQRCLIAGRALWFYAGKLVCPADLTFVYPRWHIDSGAWWQYIFPAAALALVVGLWLLRGAIGRGPLVAVLIFAGTLLPALGFFDIYPMLFSFVADHFQYLASAALLGLGAALAVAGSARLGPLGVAFLAVLLAALAALTYRQCHVYVDAASVWHDTLKKNPEAWVAHHNLATIYFQKGQYRDAAHHSEETLRLYPEQPLAHSNLVAVGVLLLQQGDTDTALRAANAALSYGQDSSAALLLRGQAQHKRGTAQAAEADYRAALRLRPEHAPSHYLLGRLLLEQDRAAEAIAPLARAAKLDADNPTYRAALAEAQARAAQP